MSKDEKLTLLLEFIPAVSHGSYCCAVSVRMSSSHWLIVLLPMEDHLTYLPAYLKLLIIVTFERISRRTSGDMISTEADMGGRSLADFHWIQDS